MRGIIQSNSLPVKSVILLGLLCAFPFVCLGLPQGGELRADLPENGRVRVINRRGSVQIEASTSSFVSITVLTDGGQSTQSPVKVQRTAESLLVQVDRPGARPQKGSGHIDLLISVPERARVSIITDTGQVRIMGVPRELNALTQSGDIIALFPVNADADVQALSLHGRASSSVQEQGSFVSAPVSPQLAEAKAFHVRLNGGRRAVVLRTTDGNIEISQNSAPAETAQSTSDLTPSQREPGPPTLDSDIPVKPSAGTPASPRGEEDVDEGDVVRVDTQMVTLTVSVVDRSTNRGLADLRERDFKIEEEGKPQEIASFEASSVPFNLILLIDLSGSTKEVVQLIRGAALRFVEAARPADRIGIITFANAPVVISPLTEDRGLLKERIESIVEPTGSTKLYDSLRFTLEEVVRQAQGARRNAIVLMSDGLDSSLPNVTGDGSQMSYSDLLREVNEFDGVLYSLWLNTEYESFSPEDIQPETFDLAHDRMSELADAGGGVFYEVERLEDLAGAYQKVVADLGTLYSIGYRPTNSIRDGKWRKIRVDVKRPNAVARGKRGYYAK